MKKKMCALLGILLLFTLSSCEEQNKDGIYIPNINIKDDLIETKIEEEDKTYYASKYISFVREVKGYFETDIPFTLENNNENIRIYDDLYFYEGDSFYLISSDYKYIWSSLKDEAREDLEVLREDGEDIEVKVKRDGIYKIALDIRTMLMDVTYKGTIDVPYYYPFKDIEIGTLKNDTLEFNILDKIDNSDEFVIKDYSIEAGKFISFYSAYSHTSTYKLSINENSLNYVDKTTLASSYVFKVGGTFDIYVNNKTYEIRVVPKDPSNLKYSCIVYENSFIDLTPKDSSMPYVFEYEYEATSDVGGFGLVSDDLPKFYDKGYQEYTFTVKESNLLGNNKGDYYFKHEGVYIITVDVLNMTLEVIKKN